MPVEALDADIIEIDAPVHARAHRRLGDDEELRLLQESANLRRDVERLVPALQQPHVARTQQAKAGLEVRLEHVLAVGEGVIAGAEQREIVIRHPFQELDRFGDLLDGKRRRIGAQIRDDAARPRQHRLPILHARRAHRRGCLPARRTISARCAASSDAFDVEVDEALALAADCARAFEVDKLAGAIALDDEHRMDEQTDVEAALIEFADDGIDQKRHVVIDDFKHRDAARRGGRLEAHLGRAGVALGEECPRSLGDAGKLVGAVALKILGHREAEQFGEEIVGNVALALCQQRRGGGDERHAGAVIAAAGNILDVHVPLSRRADITRYTRMRIRHRHIPRPCSSSCT